MYYRNSLVGLFHWDWLKSYQASYLIVNLIITFKREGIHMLSHCFHPNRKTVGRGIPNLSGPRTTVSCHDGSLCSVVVWGP